ncbi:hypothetical protein FRC03_012386 [Tulasnella sp. 419]|nr:hypothetical protein FRC03_012386 [Tulasnella sp. 419]
MSSQPPLIIDHDTDASTTAPSPDVDGGELIIVDNVKPHQLNGVIHSDDVNSPAAADNDDDDDGDDEQDMEIDMPTPSAPQEVDNTSEEPPSISLPPVDNLDIASPPQEQPPVPLSDSMVVDNPSLVIHDHPADQDGERPAKRARTADAPQATPNFSSAQHKFAMSTIRSLRRNKDATPFNHPVDPVSLNIPHYPSIIKNPMDFSTIEKKLSASKPGASKTPSPVNPPYSSADEFVADVNLVFENSFTFNGRQHIVSQMAERLQEIFTKQIKHMPPPEEQKPAPPSPAPPTPVSASAPRALSPVAPPPVKKVARRPSTSVPVIRRNDSISSAVDPNANVNSRPKREIHAPPPKDFAYTDPPLAKASVSSNKMKKQKDDGTADQLKFCHRIVMDLYKKQYANFAYFFYDPVDAAMVPNYYKVIKKPMDLSTLKKKLELKEYPDAKRFYTDFKQIIKNCLHFNPEGSSVREAGQQLDRVFEEKWSALPPLRDISDSESDDYYSEDELIGTLKTQRASIDTTIEALMERRAKKQKKRERERAERRAAKSAGLASPSSSAYASGSTSNKGKKRTSSFSGPGPSNVASSSSTPKPGHKSKGVNGVAGPSSANGKPKKRTSDVNGHGHGHGHGAAGVKDDENEFDDDVDDVDLDMLQKKELSEAIEKLEGPKLEKVIAIIQDGIPGIGNNSEEIELEIDSLPSVVLHRLYNFVVKPSKNGNPNVKKNIPQHVNGKPLKPKTGSGNTGRTGAAATGGIKRKSMDEAVEAEKIRRMEEKAAMLANGGRLPGNAHGVGSGGAGSPQEKGPGMGAGADEDESVQSSDSSGSESGSDSDSE